MVRILDAPCCAHISEGTAHRAVATEPATRLLAAGFQRLIVATHAVRRCSSCLTDRLRGRRGDSRLARCGSSRLGFAGTGDQHQGENRKHRTKYYCFFHSVIVCSPNDSAQVTSPDVFRAKNYSKFRPSTAVSLALHVSVSIREFSVLSAAGRGDFLRRAFSRFAISLIRCSSR